MFDKDEINQMQDIIVKTAPVTAKMYRLQYLEFVKVGFTSDEALKIVSHMSFTK